MQVTKNGITVSIEDHEVIRLALERLSIDEQPMVFGKPSLTPPPIGQLWEAQGGHYAGICRGRDGGQDYHLMIGPEHDGTLSHAAAVEWAKGLKSGGFADFDLMFRAEQSVAFGNAGDLFKPEWYWSREQHASSGTDAWCQGFDDGHQVNSLKDFNFRARAVRRLIIQ